MTIDTAAMRALHAGTTQERWAYTQGQVPRVNAGGVSICGIHKIGRLAGRNNQALVDANGNFIAAAHAFVPAACDEIDKLRRRLEMPNLVAFGLGELQVLISKLDAKGPPQGAAKRLYDKLVKAEKEWSLLMRDDRSEAITHGT